MADKFESITGGDASWSKIRRNGNDEVPTDRNAVKIIRTVQTEESDSGSIFNLKTKSAHTKIAKFVYEPKTDTTKGVVKSIHSFVSNNKPEVLNNNTQTTAFNVKETNIKVNENKEQSTREYAKTSTGSISKRPEDAKRDYSLRKQERQNEVKEIKKMLNQINDFTDEMSKGIELTNDDKTKEVENDELEVVKTEITKSAQPVPLLNISQRSKTDIEIPSLGSKLTMSSTPMTRKSKETIRSKRSISTSDLVCDSVKKKRSYDPEIAKKFMEEQKKKRKEMEKSSKVDKTSIDREAIKKRLDELRKCTLQILDKNLKKKKAKKSGILTNNVTQMIEKKVPVFEQSKDIKATENYVETEANAIKSLTKDLLEKIPEPEHLAASISVRKKDDILKKTDNEELIEEQMKKDSVDKENISSNVLPLTSNNKVEIADNQEKDNKSAKDKLKLIEDNNKRISKSEEFNNQKTNQESEELLLSVPKVALKTNVSFREKSVQVDTPKTQKPPIPYWLKSTPVQIYPYNFIMAVRKKLEAITNPVLIAKRFDDPNEENIKETPLAHAKHIRQSVKRKITDQLDSVEEKGRHKGHDEKSSSNSEGYTSFPSSSSKRGSIILDNQQKTGSSQKSSSATASNFSSLSMHLPVSNTISEISSIRSEGHHQSIPAKTSTKMSKIKTVHLDDDTTISSSVFSSPEKRASKIKKSTDEELQNVLSDQDISPLSVQNISKFQIKSKAIPDNITTTRGDQSDPSMRSEKPNSSEDPRSAEKSDTISEFEQLLEDFNKSLTQVIEVNHQIKTALSNTPRLSDNEENNLKVSSNIVPKKALSVDSSKSKPEDYSSDFEEALSTSNTKIILSDIDSDARSIIPKNVTEEQFEKSTSTNSSAVELKSTDSKESKFILATKKSSGSSISTQLSDFTTRQKEATDNESQIDLKPLDSAKSVTPSRSFASEEFLDSIEEMSKMKISTSNGKSNIPEVPNKSTNPENMSTLHFSKDSFNPGDEEYSQVNFFQGHVNVSRGDFMYYNSMNNEPSDKIPPVYTKLEHQKKSNNSSVGSSEIYAIFNQSDIELSMVSQTGSLSETTLNYSSLGLYEQLLQAENNKSDQLLVLLKMREKALIDRTKGQIAWLEVQKEKYKAKGLTLQISAIKKKQRAILLKMEREREEIKKMLQAKPSKKEKSKLIRPLLSNMSDIAIRKSSSFTSTSSRSTTIIRGQELQPNQSLEKILQKREEELKKRRAHVEHLIEWHKRLDKEEEEVLQMEQMLLDYNSQIKSPKILKKQKRIEDIDNSLKELQNISNRSDGYDRNSYVRTTGQKLNKLWKRLTGLKELKFEPTVKYKLSKTDLEELYEEAKMTVLRDFGQEDEMKQLLDLSRFELTSNSNKSLDFENNDKAAPQENNINSVQSDFERANVSFEKMNGFELIREDKILKEIETGSACALKCKSNSSSNIEQVIATTDLSTEYKDTFEAETKDKTHTTNAQDILKQDFVELPKELDSISQLSDSPIAKTENFLQPKAQSSDSDKIDTVAEITSLSYDTNNSFENTSKISGNITETSIQEDNRAAQSDVDSIHPLTVISNRLSSEGENQQRSSVIISRLSAEAIDETDKKNSVKEPVETETPSAPENSEEHYSESFISDESHQDSVILEKIAPSEVIHSSPSHRDSGSQVTPILSDLIETVVDEGSQEKEPKNEQLEKFPIRDSMDDTLIEDISLPKFESTAEESNSEILEVLSPSKSQQQDPSETGVSTTELEKRLIDLDVSLKELDETFERALSPEKTPSTSQSFDDDEKENMPGNQVANNSKHNAKNVKSNSDNAAILMPDIINEVEIRRRQQIFLESDLKQLEHAVPYVFLREIPNKPPPPYVPPAHGSPMTTIFPPESRIQEITYRRVRELYEEMTKTEINNHLKRPSIMDENITNIYERIILDICKEMMQELQPTFNTPNPENYKNLLALFNPPNRLKCLQDHIYKHIRKLLAMDKRNRRRNSITAIGHKKRDPVDEILIQELYEEEHKWTNFDLEEAEVKEAIVEEIYNDLLKEALDEIVETHSELIQHTVFEGSVDL